MTIEIVAAGAVALLSPYLAKAGEKFAEVAGEKLANKAGELYQVIKSKFASNTYANETLDRAEKEPDSKNKLSTLQDVLIEQMSSDVSFAQKIRQLVEEAKEVDARNIISFGERSVAIGEDVIGSTIITGDNTQLGKT